MKKLGITLAVVAFAAVGHGVVPFQSLQIK